MSNPCAPPSVNESKAGHTFLWQIVEHENEYRFTEYEYEKMQEPSTLSPNVKDQPVAAIDMLCEKPLTATRLHLLVR